MVNMEKTVESFHEFTQFPSRGRNLQGRSMSRVEQHSVQAIGLMLLAVLFFSTMDVAFKMLVEDFNSFQVVFFRCALCPALLFFTRAQHSYGFRHLLNGLRP